MTKEKYVEYKTMSETCGETWYGELSLHDAEVNFLMDLNNYGFVEKLIEIKTTIIIKDVNGLYKKIKSVIETEIDMTEKTEAYKKKFGGLRSEGFGDANRIANEITNNFKE